MGTHLRTLQRDARFVRDADRIQKHLTRRYTNARTSIFLSFHSLRANKCVEKREKAFLLRGCGIWNEKRFLERHRAQPAQVASGNDLRANSSAFYDPRAPKKGLTRGRLQKQVCFDNERCRRFMALVNPFGFSYCSVVYYYS